MRNPTLVTVLFTFVLFALIVHCSVARFGYRLQGYQRAGLYNAIVPINGVNYHLMLDLATSVTWVQCAGPHAKQAPNPPYMHHNNFVSRRDPYCPSRRPTAPESEACTFAMTYSDGSSCSGYAVRDDVHLTGNNSNAALVFGCGTYEFGPHPRVGGRLGFDGTLGLGRHRSSFISQIHEHDHNFHTFGHCLGHPVEGAYSGFLSFGFDRASQSHNQLIMLPMQDSPDLGLYVIGPADISIEGGEHRTHVQSIILDPATSYIHFNSHTYQDIEDMIELSLLLSHAPVRRVPGGGILPVCWQIPRGRINLGQYFRPIKIVFGPNRIISLPWEDYLKESDTGNKCLAILRRGDAQTANILGASAMINKLVMYDNRANRVAWGTRHLNCSHW